MLFCFETKRSCLILDTFSAFRNKPNQKRNDAAEQGKLGGFWGEGRSRGYNCSLEGPASLT